MKNYFGLDLGTSNCLAAKVIENLDDTFDVKCLSDGDGNESFPSIIYFDNENSYTVGELAASKLYSDPDSTIELVKIRMGKTDSINYKINNTDYYSSPQEISSYILRHFNTIYENRIDSATLTVPAFFDQSQKDATMQAGELAEIKITRLIEEPTAAILFHLFQQYKKHGMQWFSNNKDRNILVLDFGGGTLDLSLIKVELNDNEIKPIVLAIGGDPELGGNIIDFIFTRHVIEGLKNNYPSDHFIRDVNSAFQKYYLNYIENKKLRFDDEVTEDIKQFIFRLKRHLEQIKIKLSSENEASIVYEKNYKSQQITRSTFEETVLMDEGIDVKNKIKSALREVCKIASDKKIRVSEVVLVGGSSQIPYIRKIILEVFLLMDIKNSNIVISEDYDKAIAKGAALQAALADGVRIPPFAQSKCNSIVSRDIEIYHSGVTQTFIKMGSEYPFVEEKKYKMKIGHSLNETINIKLNEVIIGETMVTTKKEICDISFFLPLYYTDDEIEVRMNIDDAGLYQIEAMHLDTMEAIELEPIKQFSLSSAEIQALIDRAKKMRDISIS